MTTQKKLMPFITIRYNKLWSYVVTFVVSLEFGPPNITSYILNGQSIEPFL